MKYLALASLVSVAALAACSSATSNDGASDTPLTAADLPVKLTNIVAGELDQDIDHANPAAGTFKQRYWYSTEYSGGPGSPVLLQVCGESECSGDKLFSVSDSAKVLHASVITVEHRYYGTSLPFGARPTAEQLKYLTIHNALEDLAKAQSFATTNLGLDGKWIVVGGSYSGMLAAFYREKHPELVVGAWASSAPIDVQQTFYGYDLIASRALGQECGDLLRKALADATAAYADEATRNALSMRLYGRPFNLPPNLSPASADAWEANFLGFTQQAFPLAQYGGTLRLCSALKQYADAPLEGVIGFLHPPLVPDDAPVATPAAVAAEAAPPVIESPLGPGGDQLGAPLPLPVDGDPAVVVPPAMPFPGGAWFFQQCTEVGFFFTPNPDRANSILSSYASASTQLSQCNYYAHQLPAIDATRATYVDPIMNGQVSNLFFVNGTFDPWSSLSLNDPATAPAGVTVHIVAEGHHCSDLGLFPGANVGVYEAHVKFIGLARQWLAQ